MKVEVTIDKHKKLPDGAIPALEQELLRRLSQSYDDYKLTIRRTSNDGLSVLGGADGDKNALSKSCKRRGKARTTGFTDSPFGGWHFPKHRNKRVPLMLSPDYIYASVCRSGG